MRPKTVRAEVWDESVHLLAGRRRELAPFRRGVSRPFYCTRHTIVVFIPKKRKNRVTDNSVVLACAFEPAVKVGKNSGAFPNPN